MLGYSKEIKIFTCDTVYELRNFLKDNGVMVIDIKMDALGYMVIYK